VRRIQTPACSRRLPPLALRRRGSVNPWGASKNARGAAALSARTIVNDAVTSCGKLLRTTKRRCKFIPL
jgi:hypothetical protein